MFTIDVLNALVNLPFVTLTLSLFHLFISFHLFPFCSETFHCLIFQVMYEQS